MFKTLKTAAICLAAIIALYLIYKVTFIRTVNYEIAGIKIPSRYNMLTGTMKPIADYKGKAALRTVATQESGKMGLSEEQVVIAKLRWAIFEGWVNSRPEYKGWRENPEIFRKANADFKKLIKSGSPANQ